MMDAEPDILLSHDQAVRLLSIVAMLKEGDLQVRGDDDNGEQATMILQDAGEEIALQLVGY